MQPVSEPPRPDIPTHTPAGRHAEASDARMAIRHHEEQPHKKRDQEKRDPLTLPEDVYDQATLGVRAIIDFLQSFLKTVEAKGNGAGNTAAPTDSVSVPDTTDAPVAPTANPYAARAASAYQNSARTAARSQIQGSDNQSPPDQSLLQTAEIRQIHELLVKLNTLENRNVVGIKLFKAETFLQSLTNAADTALAENPG